MRLDLILSSFKLFFLNIGLCVTSCCSCVWQPKIKSQTETSKAFLKREEACMVSLLLCWLNLVFFFQGILNCRPQFLIKWCKILKLRLTKFWLLVRFRHLSSGFSASVYLETTMRIAVLLGYLVFFATSHVCIYMGHNSGLNFSTTYRNGTQSDLTVCCLALRIFPLLL